MKTKRGQELEDLRADEEDLISVPWGKVEYKQLVKAFVNRQGDLHRENSGHILEVGRRLNDFLGLLADKGEITPGQYRECLKEYLRMFPHTYEEQRRWNKKIESSDSGSGKTRVSLATATDRILQQSKARGLGEAGIRGLCRKFLGSHEITGSPNYPVDAFASMVYQEAHTTRQHEKDITRRKKTRPGATSKRSLRRPNLL